MKLAAALAAPLIGLLFVSVAEVREAARDTAQVRSETGLASAASGPAGIISRLQDERTWAVLELTGLESTYTAPVKGYEETRSASDHAISAFRADIEAKGGAVEESYGDAIAALSGLDAIRQDIDADTGPRSPDNMTMSTAIYDRYAELTEGLLDANSRISPQVRDADLRQGIELADLASRQLELQAALLRETAVTALMTPGGIDTSAEVSRIATVLSDFDANNDKLEGVQGSYARIVGELYPDGLADRTDAAVGAAITSGQIASLNTFLDTTTPLPDGGYFALRDGVIDKMTRQASTLNAQATTRQRVYTLLVVAAFLLALGMTWLVSWSITQPLRSLTRQAKELARHRLPDAVRDILRARPGEDVEIPDTIPVVVKTRDEVLDLTDALNTVQESALDLAVEQAVLRRNIADSMVSLGRRNQSLLSRQLDFITELETDEAEPEALEALFRLDHLATRMRRNAESLLVLAGNDPPRIWKAPVRLTDVIRAALGEVESFQRVELDYLAPAAITGSVATDLTHLLAELLENALTFSPPATSVTVRAWWPTPDALRLAVVDLGFGMSPSALEYANRRLQGSESYTVAPSRYLGHYVAGNLALRHGIRIWLEAGPTRGTVANVDLPPSVVHRPATPAAAEKPQLPRPAPAPQPVAAPPQPITATPTPPLPQRTRPDVAHRVPGAQLPIGDVVPLHRRPEDRQPPGPANRTTGAATTAPDDVYAYLSTFSTGVQRGLDEARGTPRELRAASRD